jgi:Domain of unknown function (DUF1844)
MSGEEGFRVTDRRGGPRDVPTADPEVPSAEGTPPPPAPSSQGASRVGAAARGAPDLSSVFVMFASSALMNLGDAADPISGDRRIDLEQARDAIDILLLLRDKTHGNLTSDESRLLEDILYDLQMRFVRATTR